MKKLLTLLFCLTTAMSANAHYEMNITNVTGAPFCKGESFTLTFGIHFAFDSTNVFNVEMSDKNGNFTTPTIVGTATGTGPATVNCTIPANMPAGTGYLFRVTSTSPAETGDPTTATYRVVNNPGASISPAGTDTICFGTTLQLSANVGTNLSYQWFKGNSAIAGAVSSQYTASTQGSYRVKVTNWAGCTKMSSYKKVVRVNCNRIGEESSQITTWPVPFNSNVFVSLADVPSAEATISVFDLQGRMVYNEQVAVTANDPSAELITADWPAGMYVLRISAPGFLASTRLIKVN